MRKKSTKNLLGFTLIELVVVMAMMAIVAAIAVPSVGAYMKHRQTVNCRDQMKSLAYEIQNNLTSKRFKVDTDDYSSVNQEIIRTCLAYSSDVKVNNGAITLSNYYSNDVKKNIKKNIISISVTGVDPSGPASQSPGTYTINWTINKNNYNVNGNITCDKHPNSQPITVHNIQPAEINTMAESDYLKENCECVAKMVGAYIDKNNINISDVSKKLEAEQKKLKDAHKNNTKFGLEDAYDTNTKFGTATQGFQDFCNSYNASWANILKYAGQYGESYMISGNTVQSGSVSANISVNSSPQAQTTTES